MAKDNRCRGVRVGLGQKDLIMYRGGAMSGEGPVRTQVMSSEAKNSSAHLV